MACNNQTKMIEMETKYKTHRYDCNCVSCKQWATLTL